MKKTCTKCNRNLKETKNNFYKKKDRFRAKCKKCTNEQNNENRILKRCREEGIDRSEWDKFKRDRLMSRDMFKLKDERLKGIPRPVRARILRKMREENYVFTTIEDYKKHCSKVCSMSARKYKYNVDVVTDKVIMETMPDYYVANRLGMRLKDIPKEILETKRILLRLKREIKNK